MRRLSIRFSKPCVLGASLALSFVMQILFLSNVEKGNRTSLNLFSFPRIQNHELLPFLSHAPAPSPARAPATTITNACKMQMTKELTNDARPQKVHIILSRLASSSLPSSPERQEEEGERDFPKFSRILRRR